MTDDPPSLAFAAALVLLIIAIVVSIAFALHPFFALFTSGFAAGVAGGLSPADTLASLQDGFGHTVGHVGVIIVTGSVIGTCLEKTGAAATLAHRLLRALGEQHAFVVLGLIGVLISTAVFADCGLLLCFPVCVAIARKTELAPHLLALSLLLGLGASHTMVPPTPGPVAAAAALEADLALVFLYGSLVAVCAALVGSAYAHALSRTRLLATVPELGVPASSMCVPASPSAPSAAASFPRAGGGIGRSSDLSLAGATMAGERLPSIAAALSPILLPVALMSCGSFASASGGGDAPAALTVPGTPAIALLIGMLTALLVLVGHRRRAVWPTFLSEGRS